jgi:hypothetical protein
VGGRHRRGARDRDAGTILFVQAVVPQESEHKRDLWLAFIRFLERILDRRRRCRRTGRNCE